MKKAIPILSAIVVLLTACGKKGPLVLEPEKLPPAVPQLLARQVGLEIELGWRYPELLSDKKTPLLPNQVRSVSIYHLGKPFAAGTFEKKAELLARPKAAEITARGGTHLFSVPMKAKQLQEREHAFAVTYLYGRSRSALSAVERIATRIPPEPVRDLKAGREGKVVMLSWSRPPADSEGRPLPALLGYRVYRRIAREGGGKAAGPFALLNAAPAKGEFYHDGDTGADGEYEYRVAALLDERVESAPSASVRLRIEDTFAPDVPANLVAFTAKDHVFLTWEAVPDLDLDHYVVYRRPARDEEMQVLAADVRENFFRDRQAAKGQQYAYAVAAVDRKGNASEPCRPVRHKFE